MSQPHQLADRMERDLHVVGAGLDAQGSAGPGGIQVVGGEAREVHQRVGAAHGEADDTLAVLREQRRSHAEGDGEGCWAGGRWPPPCPTARPRACPDRRRPGSPGSTERRPRSCSGTALGGLPGSDRPGRAMRRRRAAAAASRSRTGGDRRTARPPRAPTPAAPSQASNCRREMPSRVAACSASGSGSMSRREMVSASG